MRKLTMKSPNRTRSNIDRIAEWFPNVIVETRDEAGNVRRAVDFELLRQELSEDLVEGDRERYQLMWPGKKRAILAANAPTDKTLRPVRDESVDWENTRNLYIEGDNLEVLKLLQEPYLNKVKLIYIDPPYNTGNDFIYRDDFRESAGAYLEASGQKDAEGNRLTANPAAWGRYHSDWITMMYPRLKVARHLLAPDGAIFISIDDHEAHNMRKLCDEIFGPGNHVATIVWQRAFSPKNDSRFFSVNHDYILVYARDIDRFTIRKLPRTGTSVRRYKNPDNDPRGPWMPDNLTVKTFTEEYWYPITSPSGKVIYPTRGRCWFTSRENMQKLIDDNRIWFGETGDNMPRLKRFLSDVQDGMVPLTVWLHQEVGHNQEGRQELKRLFEGGAYFDGPKPTRLLKRIIRLADCRSGDIVLDFFSGSATVADAVMQLNAEDGERRRYILVQLPEAVDERSDAYRAGFRTICDIGRERIRRAARKIREETGADIDYGFRVFRLDSSNMKDVCRAPGELVQRKIPGFVTCIKEDRTGEDLLVQVMLELGLDLALPMETRRIEGKTVHCVGGSELVACFDEDVPESVFRKIAQERPRRAVFRDGSFADDAARINVEEIFRQLSPMTDIRVL